MKKITKLQYINEKANYLFYALCVLITIPFIFPNQLRIGLLGYKLGELNYIFLIVIGYLILNHFKIINKFLFSWIYIIIMYYFASAIFYEKSLYNMFLVVVAFIIPLFLITIKIENESFEKLFTIFLKTFNILIFLITIIGIIDIIFDMPIITFFSQFMSISLRNLILIQKKESLFRMYSIMGHPLFNTQLYLMFYILNVLYSKYFKNIMPYILVIITSIIGISLTASKTGLVLLIFSILFIQSKVNIKKIFLLFWSVLITLKLNIFQNTLIRFTSGSLTTGREEKWEVVLNRNICPIKLFTGYGLEFTYYYNQLIPYASAAFEYPYRMFSLEIGIIMMLMIYSCIFLYPTIIFILRKHWLLLISYLFIFLDVNTYNALAVKGDYMLIFCIYIMILLNLSRYIYDNKEI